MLNDAFVFPASFAQQRLWFVDQLVPDNPVYNIHMSLPLDFQVNPDVLEQVLREIIRRHETLRTCFVVEDNKPMQVVSGQIDFQLPIVDLRHLPPQERSQEVSRRVMEIAMEPFDLSNGPLFRATLITLGPAQHVFAFTIHHIIADAWSLGVFFQELVELYKAFAVAAPSPLPELEIQYADFAVWQADFLRGDLLQEEIEYWKDRLQDCPTLQMPTDRPRPPMPSFQGDSHQFQVAMPVVEQLKRLAREEDATLFMTLLTAFFVLLNRYTGQEDLVLGVPVANRNQSELEPLIGFFVNTLVFRVDVSGDPSGRELLARVRDVAVGAYAHQNVPFERLVEELQPNRDLSRNPFFQMTFQLHNEPGLTAPGQHQTSPAPSVRRATSVFDIVFDLWESHSGLMARLDYSTDLFDVATVVRLGGHFNEIIEQLASDPDRRISEISLLSRQEQVLVLRDWNDNARDFPCDKTIHQLFEECVDRQPDAWALRFQSDRLTYAELDRRANRVAHALRRRGIDVDSPVAVCMERSTEMIVGVLGILKAGGCYVGIAADEPTARIARMLEGVGCRVMLTRRETLPALQTLDVDLLLLDQVDALVAEPESRLAASAGAECLAYISFTSGSTGEPKGVAIVHRGVTRLVMNSNHAELGPNEIMLQFSPLAFDASTFEIWGSLLHGAELVVHPPGTPSLEDLGEVIQINGITTLWLTAGLFHQLVDNRLDSLRGVQQMLSGGDVLSPRHVRKLLELPGRRRVINGYGPTECTTFTTCHIMERPEDVEAPIPIGRAVSNTCLYVLDPSGQPVPVGVAGELYVGGPGLARGYVNHPQQTAERFVTRTIVPGLAERLYRTGDLVRWRIDGALEFLGRKDHQIKARGFRIEPGEVEAVLSSHPAVADVIVQASPDPSGDKRLVAYATIQNTDCTAAELRQFAQARLPAYMVPAEFYFLDQIPLTVNGKVDTRALPASSADALERRQGYVAPATEVEEALEPIWREVLDLEQIGIYDNFFTDLRGHSLLATQLISRVRDAFDIDLPLRSIFECPDIASLAVAVEEILLAEIESLPDREVEALIEGGAQS